MKKLILTAVAGVAFSGVSAFAQQCPYSQNAQAHVTSTVAVVHEVAEEKTIVEVAVSNKDFSTLVAAVKAAGLVEALSSEGPFTVFAPTNEAFAKLPAGTVEELLKPENKSKLAAILKYHVVSGKIMAGDVLKASEVKTLEGSAAGVGLTIGGANIVKTDIECSNGVIHVIDSVILPPSK
jgi:uncharacterized surface protein with fasciclin (FAS1) repeats